MTEFPPKHTCGHIKCNNCKQVLPSDHDCFLQRVTLKPPSEKYIGIDFSMQTSEVEDDFGRSMKTVTFAVAYYFPGTIKDFAFSSEDLNEFCDWLFNARHRNYTVLCHNGSRDDVALIANYLYRKEMDSKMTVMKHGKTIKYISLPKLKMRIVDSKKFLNC